MKQIKTLKGFRSNRCILAVGAELNNTVSLLKDGKVCVFSIGDLTDYDNLKSFQKLFLDLVDEHKPELIVRDIHPMYNNSVFAEEQGKALGIPVVAVQHHLAHVYSVALEHDLTDFIGIAADGTGYGQDGKSWGGEVFLNNKRVGSLEEHYLIGGDSATVRPAKFLYAILSKFMRKKEIDRIIQPHFSKKAYTLLRSQLEQKYNCPLTTSTGRVLDAVSVLLGVCSERTFEGEPAIRLDEFSQGEKPYELEPVIEHTDRLILRTTPLIKYLINQLNQDKKRLGATAQVYLARGLLEIAKRGGKDLPVVFAGGCAFNSFMKAEMGRKGVLMNKKVSCGDAGISIGQVGYVLANPGNDVA